MEIRSNPAERSPAPTALPSQAIQVTARTFVAQVQHGGRLLDKTDEDTREVAGTQQAPFQVSGFGPLAAPRAEAAADWTPGLRIEGRSPLLGMVVTRVQGETQGPMVDRTPQAVEAIGREIMLGDSGMLDAEGAQVAAAARRNLANDSRQVTLNFQMAGTVTTATLTGPEGERTFTFDMATARSMDEVEAFAERLSAEVRQACARTAEPQA